MLNNNLTADDLKKSIKDLTKDIVDMLRKSDEFGNDDSNLPPEEGMDQGSEMAPPAQPAQEGDMGGQEDQMPPEEGMGEEGGEGDELEMQLSQMSDDELLHLIEMAMGESEKRQGSAGQGDMGGQEDQMPPAQPAPEFAEKSMKEEFGKLTKSIQGIANKLNSLDKEVKSIKDNKKKVVDKPVSTNGSALQKSDAPAKKADRLSKSDTMDFLLNQIRVGNKMVSREDIADVNLARSDEELFSIQDAISIRGVKFPG